MKRFYNILLLLMVLPVASAHIGYVLDQNQMQETAGLDWQFLLTVFSNVNYVIMMLVTVLVVVGLYWIVTHNAKL